MKHLLNIFIVLLLVTTTTHAQIDKPVHWSYGTKKLPNGIIEIHLLATIDDGWHIYAQKQAEGAIAIPTKITFAKNPAVTLIGIPAERGKKETYTVKEVGITSYEYAGKVDFVQKIKVKPGVKEVKGSVLFQTCTHQKCLPEETLDFTVPLP